MIKLEKKSHRTKKELRQREHAENALLTGIPLKESTEVKRNKTAHKEFLRVFRLLEKIGKNDELYGAVINRYCTLYAELKEFEQKRERLYTQLCDFWDEKEQILKSGEMTYKEFYTLETSMQKNMIALDRQVQMKRKMLADIERENVMTIASALRSIPKKAEKKTNPLKEALGG